MIFFLKKRKKINLVGHFKKRMKLLHTYKVQFVCFVICC